MYVHAQPMNEILLLKYFKVHLNPWNKEQIRIHKKYLQYMKEMIKKKKVLL